jgi:hypothetical protein
MKRKAKPVAAELLGFHGVVFRSADPAALARRWTELTGLEPLRKSRREIVLGGPELFVVLRKAARSEAEGLAELHIAVKEIDVPRRKARPDPLGGDSWGKTLGGFDLVVRQFRRPPARGWRRKRR